MLYEDVSRNAHIPLYWVVSRIARISLSCEGGLLCSLLGCYPFSIRQRSAFVSCCNIVFSQIPSKKIEIDSSINDLADFAKTQGINYKILKIHNPWLRDKKLLNPTKKKYEIEIPLSGY